MLEAVLKWSADGQQQVIQSAKAITAEVNKGFGVAQAQRQQQAARELRRESFQRLTAEEKLARLTERRIQLERYLQRAEAQGNTRRMEALRVRMSQVQAGLGTPATGFWGSLRSNFSSSASGSLFGGAVSGGFGGAAIGGAVGGVIGTAVGAAAMKLVTSFGHASRAAKELADNLGDVAEQTGMSRTELLDIRRAASLSGVRQQTVMRSLANLSQQRAGALAGDERLQQLFANYGVSGGMLEKGSPIHIAQVIARSLGAGGMMPADAKNLQVLLGEQPGRMLSMVGRLRGGSPDIEPALARLDKLASAKEFADQERELLSLKAEASKPDQTQRWYGPRLIGWFFRRAWADSYLRWKGDFNRAMVGKADSSSAGSGARTAGDFQFGARDAESKEQTLGAFGGRSAADALSRIGLFVGANNAALRRMDQQIAELRRITRELQGMHRIMNDES